MSIPIEISNLKKQGYLATESNVKTIQHPYTNYTKVFLERKLNKITLQLTKDCNLKCHYCAYSNEHNERQRSHSPEYMTLETAKKAIDFFCEHAVDSPDVNIGFYGGEVLLAFPLLQQVVEYSEKLFVGKPLTFNVTSNTTLFTDDIIKYFQDHNIKLMVSLDGPKDINDANRVFHDGSGTYDVVMENIQRIKTVAPEYAKGISVNMVIDPINDFDCINEICLDGAELDKINVDGRIIDTDFGDKELEFSDGYTWKSEYQRFLAILAYINRFPKNEVSPLSEKNILTFINDINKIKSAAPLFNTDAPSGTCFVGKMRLFIDDFLVGCNASVGEGMISSGVNSMAVGITF